MTSPSVRKLAQELVALRESHERATTTPQLDRSSLEDGSLEEYDASGQLVQVIGKQFDGTHLAAPIAGPPPPAATGVTMQPVVGGIKVGWGGLFADDALVPMDFARAEIHVDTAPPEPDHEAMFSSLRTTINTSRGGEVLIALPDGDYYAWLIVRSASGKASPASEVVGPVSPAKVGIDDLGFDVSQFGGGTMIHYGAGDPSADPEVAAGLKTGDLWFREVTPGPPPEYETSRWVDGDWVALQDQSVGEALAKAIAAEQAVATKASIFTRPDDPSLDATVTVTAGDIWMDSDDGNRLRTWDGEAWQDRQLGSGAIKPQSLVARDVLATGTVSASLLEAVLVLASDIIGGNPQGAHVVLNEEGLTGKRADGTITLDFDTETGDVRIIGEMSTGYVGQPRVEIKRDAAGGEHRIAFHGINETPGVDRTRIYAFDLYDPEYDITVTALSLETFTEALWGRVYATHGSVGMEASETIWDEEMGRHYPAKTLSSLALYESVASIEGKEWVQIGTSNPQVTASADGSHEGTLTEWFTPMLGHPLESKPRISNYIGVFGSDGIMHDQIEVLRLTDAGAVVTGALTVSGNARVDGATLTTKAISATTVTTSGNLTVNGATLTAKAISATTVTTSGDLTVNGATTSVKALTTSGAATIGGNLTVNGASTLVKTLTVDNNLTVNGNSATVKGLTATSLTVNGTIRSGRMSAVTSGKTGSSSRQVGTTWTTLDSGNPSVTFQAPSSGAVKIDLTAYLFTTSAGSYAMADVEIRTGTTIGSGTRVRAPGEAGGLGMIAVGVGGRGQWVSCGASALQEGLVPGQWYNARFMYCCNTVGIEVGGSASEIIIIPQP